MLVLFFTFVFVCAVFFAIGFSLGRKTTMVGANNLVNASTGTPAAVVRPSAAKQNTPAPQSTDFSFYKSVGAKSTDTELAPKESPSSTAELPKAPTPVASSASTAGGYFVQVAAVSRQEDAESLVEALKKKQYPAFTANNSSADKFYHVQVGPYADLKEAEGMRTRLIADGYNPIVKK
jgi:cell division septation protein DedD